MTSTDTTQTPTPAPPPAASTASTPAPTPASTPAPTPAPSSPDLTRTSAWFGVAFTVCQLAVMVAMALFVLPHGGSPDDPALERGHSVLDAADAYRIGNYVFLLAGMLLLGFLGVVQARLRSADPTGTLATVAVAAGALLAVIWPFAAVLHDVALDTAEAGADVRILAAWDAVAPYSLAASVVPRVFFVLAIVAALRLTGTGRRLQQAGLVIAAVSALGTLTLVAGALFPVLALSSLAYELWVGALAWHWLRTSRR